MLSTLIFDGPQTSNRRFCFRNCKMSSMRVCVLPVPGGPWMRATSFEARANLTATFWDSFKLGSFHSIVPRQLPLSGSSRFVGTGVGEDKPKRTRINGEYSDSERDWRRVIVWFILEAIHLDVSKLSSSKIKRLARHLTVEQGSSSPLERDIIRQLDPKTKTLAHLMPKSSRKPSGEFYVQPKPP